MEVSIANQHMEVLKLHANGQDDHLKILFQKFSISKKVIQNNTNLTAYERQTELEHLTKTYEKLKGDTNHNFY